jgi:hypothetical protein
LSFEKKGCHKRWEAAQVELLWIVLSRSFLAAFEFYNGLHYDVIGQCLEAVVFFNGGIDQSDGVINVGVRGTMGVDQAL